MGNFLQDWLVDWYMHNFYIPGAVRFDSPGFIIDVYAERVHKVALREYLLPEAVFTDCERRVVRAEGDAGAQSLYSAGKKFGYQDADVSGLPRLSVDGRRKVEDTLYLMIHYMGGTFSDGISYSADIDRLQVEIGAKNFMICGKNGYGYMLPTGIAAGYMSFVLESPDLEMVQDKCRGRGDDECRMLTLTALEKSTQKHFSETNLRTFNWGDGRYTTLNAIRPTNYCRRSLADFIKNGYVSCGMGKVHFLSEPHFFIGGQFLYRLEECLSAKGKECLFNSAYDYGFDFAQHNAKNSLQFALEYLSCLGFGDVTVLGEAGSPQVLVNFYPWMPDTEKYEFTFFRGLASGLLSQISGKTVKFTRAQANTMSGYLALTLKTK